MDGKQSRAEEEEGRRNPGAWGRLSRGEGGAETEVGDEHRKTRANVYDTHTTRRQAGTGRLEKTSRHRAEERKDSRRGREHYVATGGYLNSLKKKKRERDEAPRRKNEEGDVPGDEEDIAGRPLHAGVMLYEERRGKRQR